jgi:prepilin-type N-terminal cleavage/methylation domain-containing protein
VPQSTRSRMRGFTLLEVAIVLIVGTLLASGALGLVSALRQKQQYTGTRASLEKVDAALAAFVALNGRLPCPANGSLAIANALSGVETARNAATGCTTDQANGVVPWRTIGISEEDATDGWYRRISYRVPNMLTANGAMNLTACDIAGGAGLDGTTNQCMAGCTAATMATACTPPALYVVNQGFPIQDIAGNLLQNPVMSTGAAYVIISHGPTNGGSYGDSGAFLAATIDGTQEQNNNNNVALAVAAYFVRDNVVETAGVGHFDDIISSPTLMVVVNRAQTGPRTH